MGNAPDKPAVGSLHQAWSCSISRAGEPCRTGGDEAPEMRDTKGVVLSRPATFLQAALLRKWKTHCSTRTPYYCIDLKFIDSVVAFAPRRSTKLRSLDETLSSSCRLNMHSWLRFSPIILELRRETRFYCCARLRICLDLHC